MSVFLAWLDAVFWPLYRCSVVPHTPVARDPDGVFEELKRGNARFVANTPRVADEPVRLRLALSGRQPGPIAMVVTCPDLRMPAEEIFSQPPGRLFVIAISGNTAGVQSVGSVQYGIAHLRISLLVVLGHTRCGAVRAVVNNMREEGCLDRVLDPIRQASGLLDRPVKEYDDPVRELAIANVRHAADGFLKSNPLLADRVGKGAIRLVEALYNSNSGVVEWLG